MTPEDLVEIELIRQLKARYFHFMDQKRWDEWEQVFCEDVVIDTTQDGPDVLHGRAVFRAYLIPIHYWQLGESRRSRWRLVGKSECASR